MLRLAALLYSLIGPTLAGTGTVIALVAGISSLAGLLLAAGAGALLALPVSWGVAKRLYAA
ncbi:hypothetical protein [Poseidonocella sp. HB161398]|uniref:hypothetical protein n=1 Tax=Poseidonocella sp. HB161398 TaxID=2320855 RepID=UPI00110977D2|nr:hypothetical protein [Poseidonocella sp. HB161398]